MRQSWENILRYRAAFAVAMLVLVSPVSAHHSDAALNMNEVVTLKGIVNEFTWRNPHAYFTVETTNEHGERVEWTVQMPSTITLARRGWTRDSLSVGEQIVVGLHPARDGRPYGLFQSIEKAGGGDSSMSFNRDSGELRFANPEAVASTSTLEGIWIADTEKLAGFPGGLDNLTRKLLTLTEKGEAALAAFDENSDENPELSCIGKPTPAMIVYTNIYPMEIEFDANAETVMIRGQFFDEERTVFMDGRGHPALGERFHEGHSIGRWEAETLVVDTANFTDHRSPYQNGIPSGAQKHVIERYRLMEDGTRLIVEFVLEDPEYIAEPMTHARELIYSPQMEMVRFDCDPEVTKRFLPQ